jgi:hypothetical protein
MWRKTGKRVEDRIDDRNCSTSLLFRGEYFHPLGFLEKNCMVSQPRSKALSTIFENPPAMEIWNPNRMDAP